MKGFAVLVTIFLVIYQASPSVGIEHETQTNPEPLETTDFGDATPEDRKKRSAIGLDWGLSFEGNVACFGGVCRRAMGLNDNKIQGCIGPDCVVQRRNFDVDVNCPGGNCGVNQSPVYPCYGGLCRRAMGLNDNKIQGCIGPDCVVQRRNFDVDVNCPGGNCGVNQSPVYPCYGGLCRRAMGLNDNKIQGCIGPDCVVQRRNFDVDVNCPGGNCDVNQSPVYPCYGGLCRRAMGLNDNKIQGCIGPDCVVQRRNFDVDVNCPGGNCGVNQSPVYPCYGGLCRRDMGLNDNQIQGCIGPDCVVQRRNFDVDVNCPGGNCGVNQSPVYPCYGGLCRRAMGLNDNQIQGCIGPDCVVQRRNFDVDVNCPGGNCGVNQSPVYPCYGGLCRRDMGLNDNKIQGCIGPDCVVQRRNFDVDVNCPGGNCGVNQSPVYPCYGGLCGRATSRPPSRRDGCGGKC